MSNQPCQHCLRGLTIGKNEVCEPCVGTGFVQDDKLENVQEENLIQKFFNNEKVKQVVKKAVPKKKK